MVEQKLASLRGGLPNLSELSLLSERLYHVICRGCAGPGCRDVVSEAQKRASKCFVVTKVHRMFIPINFDPHLVLAPEPPIMLHTSHLYHPAAFVSPMITLPSIQLNSHLEYVSIGRIVYENSKSMSTARTVHLRRMLVRRSVQSSPGRDSTLSERLFTDTVITKACPHVVKRLHVVSDTLECRSEEETSV